MVWILMQLFHFNMRMYFIGLKKCDFDCFCSKQEPTTLLSASVNSIINFNFSKKHLSNSMFHFLKVWASILWLKWYAKVLNMWPFRSVWIWIGNYLDVVLSIHPPIGSTKSLSGLQDPIQLLLGEGRDTSWTGN